jgi:hypothetical protein
MVGQAFSVSLPQHFFKPSLASSVIFSGFCERLELAQKIIRGVAGIAARLARVTESGHSICHFLEV